MFLTMAFNPEAHPAGSTFPDVFYHIPDLRHYVKFFQFGYAAYLSKAVRYQVQPVNVFLN